MNRTQDMSTGARARRRLNSAQSHEPISLALACFLVGLCAGVTFTLISIGIAHGGLR